MLYRNHIIFLFAFIFICNSCFPAYAGPPPPPVTDTLITISGIAIGIGLSGGSKPKPDPTYTFDDLAAEIETVKTSLYFDNTMPPPGALAQLPGNPPYAAASLKKANLWDWLWGKPNDISFDSFYAQAGYAHKGDLVFLKSRSDDKAPKLIRNFSTFTHVAMVYENGNIGWVFDSMPEGGVKKRWLGDEWKQIVTVSLKRLKNFNAPQVANLVDSAYQKYADKTPYFPEGIKMKEMDRLDFAKKFLSKSVEWGNKEETSSMYCSKLVWITYKPLVDLDSNRTGTWTYRLQKPDLTDGGLLQTTLWIGVSPDEIYYSKHLANDLVLMGKENLNKKF